MAKHKKPTVSELFTIKTDFLYYSSGRYSTFAEVELYQARVQLNAIFLTIYK